MKEQTLQHGAGCPHGSLEELEAVRQKAQQAQQELEATRASLGAAEKAASDAEKALLRWDTCLTGVGLEGTI